MIASGERMNKTSIQLFTESTGLGLSDPFSILSEDVEVPMSAEHTPTEDRQKEFFSSYDNKEAGELLYFTKESLQTALKEVSKEHVKDLTILTMPELEFILDHIKHAGENIQDIMEYKRQNNLM